MQVVTGAFGFIGRYIAKALLEQGKEVRTITTHPEKPNPFGASGKAFPYTFNNSDQLTANLHGADALYNTYWIRFPYDGQTYESALETTRTLFNFVRHFGLSKVLSTAFNFDQPVHL